MLSYENLYGRAQSITSDSDATTLTLLKSWINEGMRKCYAVLDAETFYDTATDATEDGVNSYTLPAQCAKMHTVTTTVSDVDYIAIEFPGTEEQWNFLTDGSSATESDYPQFFFMKGDTVELYPTPSTDDYVLTFKYKIAPKDLTADDHTTESIKTATNGSTAIVGNTGVAWTAAMVGRYFKVNADGVWYRIAAIPTATTMTLAREYAGSSIAAGTSEYTIGEMSLLPEKLQETPVEYAVFRYYLQKESSLAGTYKTLFDEKLQEIKQSSNDTTSGILQKTVEIKDPSNYPINLE